MSGRPSGVSLPLVFRKGDGGRLGIARSGLERMLSFTQRGPHDTEAGGVLIGRFIEGGEDVVVDLVTPPLPGDRRSRSRFHRAQRTHQEVIDHEWQASGGTRTYLGEWHTHPEPYPTPSTIDLNGWRQRMKRDTFHGDTLHFLIVGQVEVRAWEMRRGLCIPYVAPRATRLARTEEGES
ncbi:hypothetical protein Dcar01_01854 [Deinococcus carri]|uniref:JAB domain-containing protein n=1 Tax=Deinococcus carri TaxID=1211323 RepID=A0ABP9WAT2_9DEIO